MENSKRFKEHFTYEKKITLDIFAKDKSTADKIIQALGTQDAADVIYDSIYPLNGYGPLDEIGLNDKDYDIEISESYWN